MAKMSAEIYRAFKAADIDDRLAEEAAEAVAGASEVPDIKADLSQLKQSVSWLKGAFWAHAGLSAFIAVVLVALLGMVREILQRLPAVS